VLVSKLTIIFTSYQTNIIAMDNNIKKLLDALNVYSREMKAGAINKPITIHRVKINDNLIDDKLVIDKSYSGVNKQIEAGNFESGNTFATTTNGDIVYTSEYIAKKYFKIDFLVEKKILMRIMDKQNEYLANT